MQALAAVIIRGSITATRMDLYTVLAIFKPGCVYPEFVVTDGVVEFYVLTGTLIFNSKEYGPGTFIQMTKDERGKQSSVVGCEFLVTLKGKVKAL